MVMTMVVMMSMIVVIVVIVVIVRIVVVVHGNALGVLTPLTYPRARPAAIRVTCRAA